MTAYIPDTLKSVLGRVGFFGGSHSQNTDIDHNTSTTPHDAARSPRLHTQRDRDTYDPASLGVGKRGREVEIHETEARKRRVGARERGQHLEPNYTAPPDAKLIYVEDPKDEESPPPRSTRNMPVKPGSGGSRFNNGTIYQGQPLSTRNGTRRLSPPKLALQSSRGKNAQVRPYSHGDGFQNDNQPPSKKQKVSNGRRNPGSPQVQIDLTEDNSQDQIECFGEVMGRASSQTSRQSQHRDDQLIGSSVSRRTDQYTQLPREKKRRKSMSTSRSSQESARATPDGTQLLVVDGLTYRFLPEAVEVADVNESNAGRQRTSAKPSDGSQAVRPPSAYDHGNDDLTAATKGKDSERNTRSRFMQPAQTSKPDTPRPATRRTIHQQDDSFDSSYLGPPQRLNDTFIRDGSSHVKQPKMTASQRLQQTQPAKSNPGRQSYGSEDELNGAVTVPSQASRSASPQKHSSSAKRIQHSRHDNAERDRSPNLQATAFYSSKQEKTKGDTRRTRKPQSPEAAVEARIPVNSIQCRSCVLGQRNIVLHWDDDSMGFLVECGGEFQKVPNRAQFVCIGQSEVRHWIWAKEDGALAVQLRGAFTENSNGQILLDFVDVEGMSECYQYLLHATNDAMKTLNIPKEKMVAIFRTQGPLIRQDYDKRKLSAPQHKEEELASMQNRRLERGLAQPLRENRILYEDEDTTTRQTSRQRMQPGVSDANGSPTVKSKYYTYPQPRRSSRQPQPIRPRSPTPPPLVRWTHENKIERWSHSVVYPPEGATRRVTVDFQDLERLDEGEFLNDNIISFALRRIEENMAPKHKEHVHFFNSFFYTALTTKNGKKAFNYDAVKRWTKSKDIFSFPYLVVPINIDLHWFVAIICNLPNLQRKAAGLDEDGEQAEEMLDDITQEVNGGDETKTEAAQESMDRLSLSDQDEANDNKGSIFEFDDSGLVATHAAEVQDMTSSRPSTASSKKSRKKAPPPPRRFNPDTPTIVTLDSFGSTHSAETRNLKDYLNAEAEQKRGMDVGTKDLQGMTAKGIPEQTNFCDCGLYLVGYVEEFAKDPSKFITKVLQKELDQHSDFANFDPSAKRAEIRDELLQLYQEQDAERKAKKSAKKSASKVKDNAPPAEKPSTQAETHVEAHTPSKPPRHTTAPSQNTTEHVHVVAPVRDEADIAVNGASQGKPDDDDLPVEAPRPLLQSLPVAVEVLRQHETASRGMDGVVLAHPGELEKPTGSDLLGDLEQEPISNTEALREKQIEGENNDDDGPPEVASSRPTAIPERRQGLITTGKEVVQLDGSDEREAEVPDSQEKRSHTPSAEWSGRRITFED